MANLLEQTVLWKKFESISTTEQISMVRKCCKDACDRLTLVRDTFPTYTLHNERHAINIVNIMGDLLQRNLDNVNSLELAILILSAFYHDIGMVFSEEERNDLVNDRYFPSFLEQHPKADISVRQHKSSDNSEEIPEDIAEWYCRWCHPDKSADYLLAYDGMDWDNYPINRAVAEVCKSHGYSIEETSKNDKLDTSFYRNADLLFCAIILRCADILDFDNSRSPDQVYEYLGLSKRNTKRESESDVE